MPKYNVRAFHLKAPLNFSTINEEAHFKPCAAGEEMSVGLIAAGPLQDSLTWKSKGAVFLEWAIETRRVPKPWIEAEYRRRVAAIAPGVTVDSMAIHDQVKAELWMKVIPVKKYGWIAYVAKDDLLIVQSSVRHAEYLTSMLRTALGGLPTDAPYHPRAFESMVRAYIRGEQDSDNFSMGRRVDLVKDKAKVTLRNFLHLAGNDHVADHLKQCSNVTSASFNIDCLQDEADDITATPYGELTLNEIKDKEADEYGTMILRLDRVQRVLGVLHEEINPHTPDNWRKL